VKRDSPQSRLRLTAPSPRVPAPRVFGRAVEHAKQTFVWSSTERAKNRLRDESDPMFEAAPKGAARGSR